MRLFLITHGPRECGTKEPDPGHTNDALIQFSSEDVVNYLDFIAGYYKPTLVVHGSGRRFVEAYHIVRDNVLLLQGIPAKSSPFCGTDVCRKDEDGGFSMVLPDGTVIPGEDYIGPANLKGVDYWEAFIGILPKGTILFAGRELMMCLGAAEKSASCSLYQLDPENKAVDCLIHRGREL